MVTPLVNNWGADPPTMGERYARSEKLALFGTTDSPMGHQKTTCERVVLIRKLASCIVGTGVLDCPLEKKLIRRKQIIIPDRLKSVGVILYIGILEFAYDSFRI